MTDDMGDLDWDEIVDALAILKEWAEAEDREDVIAALDTIIAAVKEQQTEPDEGPPGGTN